MKIRYLLKSWLVEYFALIGLLFFFILMSFLTWKYHSSIKDLKLYLESFGFWSPCIYVFLIMIAMLTSFTPSVPIIIIGGVIYDKFTAFLLSLMGILLGQSLAYLLGLIIGMSFVEKHLSKISNSRLLSGRMSFGLIFVLRLFPVPFYDLVGYLSGAFKVPFFSYFSATLLGVFFPVFILSYLGEEVYQNNWEIIILLVLVLLGIFIVWKSLIKQFISK